MAARHNLIGFYPHSFYTRVGTREECWPWLGTKYTNGYGLIWINDSEGRKPRIAHRVAYMIAHGPIPQDMTIDHLCNNRECQNPGHMALATRGENVLRGDTASGVNSRKTHCVRGHEFTPDNTWIEKGKRGRPSRRCKQCRAAGNILHDDPR